MEWLGLWVCVEKIKYCMLLFKQLLMECNILCLMFLVRVWDVRPYAPVDRQLKIFLGAQHGFEKVSFKVFEGC